MSELPIVAVVVHRDGAIVERRGRVPIVDGQIVVSRLPVLLEERSVRVEVGGATLLGHRFALDVEGIDRADETALQRERWDAADAVLRLETELVALTAERATVFRLAPGKVPAEDRPTIAAIAGWATMTSRLTPWAEAIDARLRALGPQLELARQHLANANWRAQSESSAARVQRWIPTRRAVLRISGGASGGNGEADVAVSYRVEAAAWAPSYGLFATGALRRGSFAASALVAQATGEDWRGVKLAFSTAPSARAIDVPELAALRLGKAQPSPKSPWRDLPADLDALFPPELAIAPAPAPIAPAPTPPTPRHVAEPEPIDALFEADDAPFEPSPVRSRKAAGPPMPQSMPSPSARAPTGAPMMQKSTMPSMPMAAAPMMLAEMAASAIVERASGGGGPPRRPPIELPGPLEVGADALDYGNLRLPELDDPRRGRLIPATVADEAREAGLEPAAAQALDARRAALSHARGALRFDSLPAHHVLPGPIEVSDHKYDAEGAVDVPSDGKFRAVSLFTDAIELEVRYRVVPRLDPRAFRTVRAVLPRAVPMIAGPVHVHIDGALAIVAPWAGSPRGGELNLGVGVEPNLRIARNVRYREESAGMIGGYRRTHTEVEVEIASALSRQAEVEVLERVPVTHDTEITIEVVAATPVAEAWKGDPASGPILDGGRRQLLQVPAGGKATAKLHFTVTVSSRLELDGGDRRG